jgi:hypothetical protein
MEMTFQHWKKKTWLSKSVTLGNVGVEFALFLSYIYIYKVIIIGVFKMNFPTEVVIMGDVEITFTEQVLHTMHEMLIIYY